LKHVQTNDKSAPRFIRRTWNQQSKSATVTFVEKASGFRHDKEYLNDISLKNWNTLKHVTTVDKTTLDHSWPTALGKKSKRSKAKGKGFKSKRTTSKGKSHPAGNVTFEGRTEPEMSKGKDVSMDMKPKRKGKTSKKGGKTKSTTTKSKSKGKPTAKRSRTTRKGTHSKSKGKDIKIHHFNLNHTRKPLFSAITAQGWKLKHIETKDRSAPIIDKHYKLKNRKLERGALLRNIRDFQHQNLKHIQPPLEGKQKALLCEISEFGKKNSLTHVQTCDKSKPAVEGINVAGKFANPAITPVKESDFKWHSNITAQGQAKDVSACL